MLEKTERNLEIYKKWKDGTSQFALAVEYGLHPQRIGQIISLCKRKYE